MVPKTTKPILTKEKDKKKCAQEEEKIRLKKKKKQFEGKKIKQ